ncbi:MAG: GNAT family N-acetyltransferase [bacterium]|nr:GNAT family N-acetyltransferase [bacterium]
MITFAPPSREQFYRTHCAAFADYHLDMSYMTEERIWKRFQKNAVDFERSIGAYDGERMVGFTMIGVDRWQGKLAAFDAATGIIPEYRGQGLARAMFDHAVPGLRDVGVQKFLLEVLQPNKAAIRAYEKAGFSIQREFACFDVTLDQLDPNLGVNCDLGILPVAVDKVMDFQSQVAWAPSWENSFAAMSRIQDDLICLGAFEGQRCVGVVAYYTVLNWIMTVVVSPGYRRRGVASKLLGSLLTNICDQQTVTKLNNVDASDTTMITALEKAGFRRVVDQFEMELVL